MKVYILESPSEIRRGSDIRLFHCVEKALKAFEEKTKTEFPREDWEDDSVLVNSNEGLVILRVIEVEE